MVSRSGIQRSEPSEYYSRGEATEALTEGPAAGVAEGTLEIILSTETASHEAEHVAPGGPPQAAKRK